MIYKYNEFLLESQIVKLINEARLAASFELITKLAKIKDKNSLAKQLYDFFNEKFYIPGNLAQNFIDVAEEDDKITFISDERAVRSYQDGSGPFEAKGRGSIKIGRFLNALLTKIGIDFTPKDIEEFVNLYKSIKIDNTKIFKLISGEEIAEWYSVSKYNSGVGTLGSSCMREVNEDFFDIYTKNSQVQLLICVNSDNKLIGRAIVWKLYESPCEAKYFMDRVYTEGDSDILRYKQYAIEKGWMYKSMMTSNSEEALFFFYNEQPVFGRVIVKLDDINFDHYPYLDTLPWVDMDNNLLSNVGFKDGSSLDDTEGGYSNCYDCEGTGEKRCETCDGEETVDCEKCEGNGSIECTDCEGNGSIECTDCDGGSDICASCKQGKIKCSNCSGKGLIGMGRGRKREECASCDGTGELDCEECGGDWEKVCKVCDGEYEKDCLTCKGEGSVECKVCDGGGTQPCSDCDGSGVNDCDSCVGIEKEVRHRVLMNGGPERWKQFKSFLLKSTKKPT